MEHAALSCSLPAALLFQVLAGTPGCQLMTCNGHSFLLQHYWNTAASACFSSSPQYEALRLEGHDLTSA